MLFLASFSLMRNRVSNRGCDLADQTRFNAELLGRGLAGEGLGAGLGEFEADEPIAGDAVTVHFGGGEFPAAGRLQSEIGEIFARAGGIEFGLGDVSAGLDVGADRDAHFALNSAASSIGDVGQNLVEDFPVRGRDGGGFGRVGRWKRISPQRRPGRSRSCDGR